MRRLTLLRGAMVVCVCGALAVLHHYAPLQPASFALYAGAVLALLGILSVAKPLAALGIRSRRAALALAAGGLTLSAIAAFWPASTTRVVNRQTLLDAWLPVYEFEERHEVDVQAPPERVLASAKSVTFGELSAMHTLMRIRAIAMRGPRPTRAAEDRPVVAAFSSPGSAFLPLAQNERELVFGSVGQPWANRAIRLGSPEHFQRFGDSGFTKMAFNLRVADAGRGHTLLITETRVHATDANARRKFASYWRLIYPGSGILRRMWIDAARDRAEGP